MDPRLTRRGAGVSVAGGEGATRLRRRKPRSFEEWKALASWRKLPAWELRSPGYQLRRAREEAGLTQADLAARLGVSQQAVARTERWNSNPTVRVLEVWAEALGGRLELEVLVREDAR